MSGRVTMLFRAYLAIPLIMILGLAAEPAQAQMLSDSFGGAGEYLSLDQCPANGTGGDKIVCQIRAAMRALFSSDIFSNLKDALIPIFLLLIGYRVLQIIYKNPMGGEALGGEFIKLLAAIAFCAFVAFPDRLFSWSQESDSNGKKINIQFDGVLSYLYVEFEGIAMSISNAISGSTSDPKASGGAMKTLLDGYQSILDQFSGSVGGGTTANKMYDSKGQALICNYSASAEYIKTNFFSNDPSTSFYTGEKIKCLREIIADKDRFGVDKEEINTIYSEYTAAKGVGGYSLTEITAALNTGTLRGVKLYAPQKLGLLQWKHLNGKLGDDLTALKERNMAEGFFSGATSKVSDALSLLESDHSSYVHAFLFSLLQAVIWISIIAFTVLFFMMVIAPVVVIPIGLMFMQLAFVTGVLEGKIFELLRLARDTFLPYALWPASFVFLGAVTAGLYKAIPAVIRSIPFSLDVGWILLLSIILTTIITFYAWKIMGKARDWTKDFMNASLTSVLSAVMQIGSIFGMLSTAIAMAVKTAGAVLGFGTVLSAVSGIAGSIGAKMSGFAASSVAIAKNAGGPRAALGKFASNAKAEAGKTVRSASSVAVDYAKKPFKKPFEKWQWRQPKNPSPEGAAGDEGSSSQGGDKPAPTQPAVAASSQQGGGSGSIDLDQSIHARDEHRKKYGYENAAAAQQDADALKQQLDQVDGSTPEGLRERSRMSEEVRAKQAIATEAEDVEGAVNRAENSRSRDRDFLIEVISEAIKRSGIAPAGADGQGSAQRDQASEFEGKDKDKDKGEDDREQEKKYFGLTGLGQMVGDNMSAYGKRLNKFAENIPGEMPLSAKGFYNEFLDGVSSTGVTGAEQQAIKGLGKGVGEGAARAVKGGASLAAGGAKKLAKDLAEKRDILDQKEKDRIKQEWQTKINDLNELIELEISGLKDPSKGDENGKVQSLKGELEWVKYHVDQIELRDQKIQEADAANSYADKSRLYAEASRQSVDIEHFKSELDQIEKTRIAKELTAEDPSLRRRASVEKDDLEKELNKSSKLNKLGKRIKTEETKSKEYELELRKELVGLMAARDVTAKRARKTKDPEARKRMEALVIKMKRDIDELQNQIKQMEQEGKSAKTGT